MAKHFHSDVDMFSINDEDVLSPHVENHPIFTENIESNFRDPSWGYTRALQLFQQGYGPYQPKPHNATKDVNGRKFLFKWYGEILWLEYSPNLDHAFCFPCRIFGRIGRYEEAFVSAGLRKWKVAIDKFRKHQCTAVHITAMERWTFGKQAHENP